MSLLDQARQIKIKPRGRNRKYDPEEVDALIRAYLKNEITFMQVGLSTNGGYGKNISNYAYSLIAQSVRRMFDRGELVFAEKKKSRE